MRFPVVFLVLTTTGFGLKNEDPSCVPPPFLSQLPQKAADDINKIWSSYTPGFDCTSQKNATVAILKSLQPSDHRPLLVPKKVEGPIVDPFDTTPSFIRSLSPEIRQEFDAIWVNSGLTDNDKYSQLEELAQKKFSPEQKLGFDSWIGQVRKTKEATEERIKNLTPEAKEILKELVQIRAAEERVRQKMTAELANELEGLV